MNKLKVTVDKNSRKKVQAKKAARIQELEKVKKKSARKQGVRKWLKRVVVFVVICGIAAVGYFGYNRWDRLQRFNEGITAATPGAKVCDSILNPKCWGEALSPKLNQANGETVTLIVGLDTRDEGGVASGLMNTDSIMVAVYNHQTKKTSLISLPRDLRVPFYVGEKGPFYAKINAIYSTGEQRSDVEDGFDLLQDAVEDIVGKEIQYRVVIKLRGVEDAVDAVGGVTIDVPTDLKVSYPNDYPGEDGKPHTRWLTYEFEEGLQEMDGEKALVWARFRKVISGDMSYASDFSRAERQQVVLDALKEKALSENGSTLDKAEKYWDIFQTLNKNVEANIGLEEIFAGLTLADEADTDPVNIVMDPNFGGLNQIIYHPPTDETGGYIIKFKDESFQEAQEYLALIEQYPKLYDEEAKILIENHMGRSYISTDPAIKLRNAIQAGELPITTNQLTMITKSKSADTGIVIVDFGKGENSGTTKYLADYFGSAKIIEDPETYGYEVSGYKEDVLIMVNPVAE